MKNNLIKSLLFGALIVIGGCSKELNTVPTTSVDATTALQTSDDVKAAVIGSYDDFGSSYLYGGDIFLEADLLANTGDINWSGTYQGLTQINNKTIPKDNGFVTNNWLSGYTAINDVNNVLSAVSVVGAADSSSVLGQAKFIRGATYFELVKRFAKAWNDGSPATNAGVPLVLAPTLTVTNESKVKRNTVSEVYAQVISDLVSAEASLPLNNDVYANKGAAAALLARVYLQQGDYLNAAQAANRAIIEARTVTDKSPVKLNPTYSAAFGASNTSEDIFAIQVTPTSGTNDLNTFYSSAQRGEIQINDTYFSMFEAEDDRKNFFYSNGGSEYSGKFEQRYGNVHTIRLAEMLLIRAESNFRLGTSVGGAAPVDDINLIRNRAKLHSYNASQLTLNNILQERRLELAFEGFSLDDIKRLQQNVGSLPWNSPKLIFPIPNREIIVNPNLQQNEGY